MRGSVLLATVCWLPLAACSSWQVPEDQPAPHVGEAVHHNIAAQIANPKAPEGAKPEAMSGERAALAQDRYATGKTIKPEDVEAKTSGNGGTSQ